MRLLSAALLLAALATPALADPKPAADVTKMKGDDCARARAMHKTCVLTIEGEDVEGNNPTAGGAVLTAPDFGQAGSLIRIRREFIAEILKTAEDL